MEKLLFLLCISLFATSSANNTTEDSQSNVHNPRADGKKVEDVEHVLNLSNIKTASMEESYFYSGDYPDWPYESEGKAKPRNVVGTLYIIIAAVGLLANCVVFFVIFCGDEISKTVTAIYVLQLAVADTAFLIALPFFALQLIDGWMFGQAACVICKTISFLNYYSGIFFLTAMSIDRYIAVAYSTKANQLRTKTRTIMVCMFVWIASAIMSLPAMLYATADLAVENSFCIITFPGYQRLNRTEIMSSIYDYYPNDTENYGYGDYYIYNDTDKKLCQHENQPASFYVNEIVKFIVGFVIPFGVITVSYALIIKQLQISEKKIANKVGKRTHNMRRRVTRMVSALVICFAVCWLPSHIFSFIKFKGVYLSPHVCYTMESFFLMLGYSNSAFNPILYTFLGYNFQDRLMESLQKTKQRITRGGRAITSGSFNRRNSHKNRSFTKRMTGHAIPLSTNCEADNATVVTENHALRDGKRVPLIEMSIKKQTEGLWNSELEQDEKSKCLSRS